ncbi:alpha/beta hydrolase [Pelagicoccus sp. SDUM812005]|nr:alpha/beta hydrolase [Pelagicoccus sp. SDUM812005]
MKVIGAHRFLIGAFLSVGICVLGGCANSLFYHPDEDQYSSPDEDGLRYETLSFSSSGGPLLHGWWVYPEGEESKGIVLHYHGNAQNLGAHYRFVSWLPQYGYELMVFDYRGYGRSEGKPNRKGLFEDSLAALEFAEKRAKRSELPLFVIGQSLGGANAIVALGVEQRSEVKGLVVDSAFSSYRSVAKAALGKSTLGRPLLLALPTLVSEGLDPIDYVSNISPTPIAFVHGTADTVVPYEEGRRLEEAAGEPKYFWTIEGGQHVNALSSNRHIFVPRILEFFQQCLNGEHRARPVVME